ncbi:sensor histidine kinase [Pedobacter gandavensis]|uniref:sensor histidine kinase n=1 Tax=Pedobacter gandavensis TaxID=2679963 RepID=UPI00292F1A7C|nr:ATP-binding protein [Pedobacter gandavensis]
MAAQENIDVYFFLFTGMIVMFVLSAAVVVLFFVYQKKFYHQQVALREKDAEYQQKLLHNNIEKIEEERRRVAKDLHDEVGSIFSTIGIKIIQFEKKNNALAEDNGGLDLIKDTKLLVDKGVMSVRRISHNMIPNELEMFGIAAAIEELCFQIEGSDGLDVNFESEGLDKCGRAEIELALYRITQELISNTVKHARAKKVEILLNCSDMDILYQYKDDGIGFDMDQIRRGLGIQNITSRVEMNGGQITYHSGIQGFGVSIYFPA